MYQFQSLNFDILFARIFDVPAADWPYFDPTKIRHIYNFKSNPGQ